MSLSFPNSPQWSMLAQNVLRKNVIFSVVGAFVLFYLVFWSPPDLHAFHKVYAIGFAERTDKRDAQTLAASFTGFQIERLPGVSYEDVSIKAAPSTWDHEKQSPGALGCWRAHMNAMEEIVANRIQTAIVFEDDSDWDVNLKSQLHELAHGVRSLDGSTSSARSPFGETWDYLWLGHCRAGPTDEIQNFYVVENDTTVPPVNQRHSVWRNSHVPDELLSNTTRTIFKANGGMCMYAYGVTFEGARKILAGISLESQNLPVDVSMSAMCRERFVKPFTCYSAYPSLISSHRFAGAGIRDSDLNKKPQTWHPEHTWDIVYSAIMNVPRLVSGKLTAMAQWPEDVDYPEISLDEEPTFRGELRTMDLGSMEKVVVKGINQAGVWVPPSQ